MPTTTSGSRRSATQPRVIYVQPQPQYGTPQPPPANGQPRVTTTGSGNVTITAGYTTGVYIQRPPEPAKTQTKVTYRGVYMTSPQTMTQVQGSNVSVYTTVHPGRTYWAGPDVATYTTTVSGANGQTTTIIQERPYRDPAGVYLFGSRVL